MAKKPEALLNGVLLGQLACVVITALLVYSRSPNNHWGADIRWASLLGVAGVGYGFFLLATARHKRHATLAIAASLVFVSLIYSADRFNVLVHHERWIQRGMPPSPFAVPKL